MADIICRMSDVKESRIARFAKTKTGQFVLLLAAVGMAAFSVVGFMEMARKAEIEGMVNAISKANEELGASAPGVQTAEQYVRRLKAAVDQPGPADVKHALNDYIQAWERGIEATKADSATPVHDTAIANSRARLIEVVQRYD